MVRGSDIHEADMNFQSNVRDSYIMSMRNGINCQIIPCAQSIGEDDNQTWHVWTPEEIFEKYRMYLDYVLLGKDFS